MEHASNQDKSAFATEPVGRLIVKFAIPCVISLVVNALYNIVDQIFIGWGVGYLGNGATNIVFPITIIALALAVLIGDGGAAYLSLKLGEGDLDSVKKGVGNAAVMITIAGIAMLVITIVFMNPILTLFGATDVLRPAALEYGYVIAIGLPFTMISTALNAMIRADGSPKFAMVSMLLGAIINTVFDPIFIFIFDMGVRGAAIATILGQIISFLVSIFYLPRFKTFHFDRSALRLHKRVCLSVLSLGVSSFITQIASTIVMALFNNLLAVYGAASVYGSEIIAIIAFFIFQFAPMSVVSIFGFEEGLYNEFAVKCFRIFLMLCPLNGSRLSPPSICRQSASPSSQPSSRCPDRSSSSSRLPCCCPRRWVLSVCSEPVRPPMPWPSSSHWL